MTRDQVIEKIKKLLRMKRGGTQGEIENALAMAAELARKHGIDLAGVDPDAEEEKIRHETDALTSRLPLDAKLAAAILVNYFNVQVLISNRQHPTRPWTAQYLVNYIGTTWDISVARYVFVFLQRHFRSSWTNRPNRRLQNREAFLNGMFIGLSNKLYEQRKVTSTEAGLVLVGRAVALRKAYVDKTWPNNQDFDLDPDDSDAHAARWAGLQAGRNTEIRGGVGAGSAAAARPQLPPPVGQLALL
jgi:hypothetical protein